MACALTSAAGILSLLEEPEDELKKHALEELDKVVDQFWSEIAPSITKIQELCDDENFESRNLASIVTSKVYYHLEELKEALTYALGAGNMFDIEADSEYVKTVVATCIDEYIRLKREAFVEKKDAIIDPRLKEIVESMFERCFGDGQYKHALGIALESRRLDIIQKSIKTSGDAPLLLEYCFGLCQNVVMDRKFRHEVFAKMVEMYKELPKPDYINMCQCLLFLGDHVAVAKVLLDLLDKGNILMAFQVAFDLTENQNYSFLLRVCSEFPSTTDESKDEAPSDLTKLKNILKGEFPINLYLHFLYGQSKTDLNVLNWIKEKLDTGRSSNSTITHNATVMAHAIMNCGTSIDTFLRDNLEWLGRAKNWAKFTATASIGVIHKGHHKESLKLLQPYLPQNGSSGSPYQEGGALYALGLIHANGSDKSKIEYLEEALRNAGTNEIVQHGACLGIGLVAMSSGNEELFQTLTAIVYNESAVAGEAAGIALGLVFLGTAHGESIQDMLNHAHDTKHEKIIRGLALGLAMIMYGREEEADTLIEQLVRDKDPILRFGGMYTIALAYVATSNNNAIRRLLHVAVSDVSDDVRRAAVTALGFVLCKEPQQVPRIVSLLAESYNPHVRYGACLAVGTACAGTGLKEAIQLLKPLCKDEVDFVRQGAFIGMAMVLIQHNEKLEPEVQSIRATFRETIAGKTDTMAKLGAILGYGIIDAGGRNVTMSMISPAGHKKMAAIVGMALFPQFWYWFPNVHFISLAFTPTAVIGLNKDLLIPAPFKFVSKSPPSLWAYPAPMEIKKKEEKKELKKATLSVTKKAKARAKKKRWGCNRTQRRKRKK